jgi:hypothetical protein
MRHDPYLKDHRYCVFDIETTGLMPSKDMLISASFHDPLTGETTQFFSDSPLLEKITVQKTVDKLAEYDAVITYNGRRFDLPFLLYRAKVCRAASALPLFWSIDLYQWLRRYWPLAESLPSLRQKAVEEVLGLSEKRTDEIDGAECISLYTRFLSLGDEKAKETILLHNADDVRQLSRVADAINFLPWHQIAFESGFSSLYPGGNRAILGPARLTNAGLSLKAKTAPGALPASFFGDGYRLEYSSEDGIISLNVAAEKNEGLVFADLERLPADPARFSELPGFHEGFLLLSEDGDINYRECNALSAAIISTLF